VTAFEALVGERRSIRRFLDRPVSWELLERLFLAARRAPSGANLQPGQFILLRGEARRRLSEALADAYRAGAVEPEDYSYFPQPMPLILKKRQVAAAKALQEALGLQREDRAGRDAQFERNFHFFDAPVAMVATMDSRLGTGCYMDFGMCLYGLMLAATAEGLGTCAIGALASYPSLIRRELDLSGNQHIVCGLALGWPDDAAPENKVHTERLGVADFVSLRE
jgi:nitroreductase